MSAVQGFKHDPGLPSGFVYDTELSLPLLPSVWLPVFLSQCSIWKAKFCCKNCPGSFVKEEDCTLEKQMFKAAALCGVTQLCGLGFANNKAAKLSSSMKPVSSHLWALVWTCKIFHQLQWTLPWKGMSKARALWNTQSGGSLPGNVGSSWESGEKPEVTTKRKIIFISPVRGCPSLTPLLSFSVPSEVPFPSRTKTQLCFLLLYLREQCLSSVSCRGNESKTLVDPPLLELLILHYIRYFMNIKLFILFHTWTSSVVFDLQLFAVSIFLENF